MHPNERLMNKDLLEQIETVDWSKVREKNGPKNPVDG